MNPSNPPGYYQQQPPNNPVILNQQTMAPSIPQNQGPFIPAQNVISDLDFQTDGLVEPIIKCKTLYEQLKTSLQLLLIQLNSIINPSASSSSMNEKLNAVDQFVLFGKSVENFNKVCDLLIVNLRVACEAQTISVELKQYTRYFSSINPVDHDLAVMALINAQMQRMIEFKSLFQRYLANSNQNVNQMPQNQANQMNQ